MLKKLTERIYYMPHSEETDRPILGLVCGDKYSLIVDAGNSSKHAKEFMDEVAKLDIPPVKFLVITHYHWDHVYGIDTMNLLTIGQKNILPRIKEMQGWKWDDETVKESLADGTYGELMIKCMKGEMGSLDCYTVGDIDMTFDQELTIDLGGIECYLEKIGGHHTEDGLVVHVPSEDVLFIGDCIYGSRFEGVYGYDREPQMKMLRRLKEFGVKHFICSHEEVFDDVELNEFIDQQEKCSSASKGAKSLEEAKEKFITDYARQPEEDEEFYMKCFYEVDQVLRKEA